eukprot:2718607-Amphidinium_carterae.1
MSNARAAQLEADILAARERFIGQITELHEEDGSLTISVTGYGDFLAALPEPYPGETTIYGPEDYEFTTKGIVADILADLLTALSKSCVQRALTCS